MDVLANDAALILAQIAIISVAAAFLVTYTIRWHLSRCRDK